MMRRRIRFAAVLVVVVLALSGFSTAGGGGKGGGGKSRSGKSSGSGGGGCSSSKKSNDDHVSDDSSDDDSSGGSSGGTGYGTPTPGSTATDAPEVRVIRCAQARKGRRGAVTSSVVQFRSTASGTARTYDVEVAFLDARGRTVDTGEATADSAYGEVTTLSVRMDSPRKVSRVKSCRVTARPRR
ncbi:hypothetical protein [Streptomyces fulvorobeus]|uniref:Secreted protein n=1 Tax=Streptomyces fulvorobeus TaxID=284028 RepID=A0A7J0C9Y3_9ACTN|nr:hypothetical protein [Streptomyces fulvorobeus]NYE42311.1 hypothetical protein [Streptomyces fulvorobeus]GFM98703.1 hypothetical protein Sfulv_35140 [Streptomyces fulvorobeus]